MLSKDKYCCVCVCVCVCVKCKTYFLLHAPHLTSSWGFLSSWWQPHCWELQNVKPSVPCHLLAPPDGSQVQKHTNKCADPLHLTETARKIRNIHHWPTKVTNVKGKVLNGRKQPKNWQRFPEVNIEAFGFPTSWFTPLHKGNLNLKFHCITGLLFKILGKIGTAWWPMDHTLHIA